jgi:outer membrane receptor protein involved in Fe transport
MRILRHLPVGLVMLAFCASSVAAQQPAPRPAAQPAAEEEEPEVPAYEETIVVTASRVEQTLVNAPATVTVIDSRAIENTPGQHFGELLRSVPGLNITQTSARDIQLTSRSATGTLATSQLALLDGRTIYQDFFGFVMWDMLPVNLNEIKQIEVIRGPASAIWGANAQTGVVNVITKPPREMQGTSFTLGAGGFDRGVGPQTQSTGSIFYLSGTHAQAVDERWAFKVSAGAYTQDAMPRPVGRIPNAFGTPFPPFENQGTTQPKFDGRVDYDFEDGRQKLIFAGGYAGTEGIIHTGIGPFDISRGSAMGYGKVNYSRGALRVNFFTNILDGDAANLLTRDPLGSPILFAFNTKTFDVEVGNVQTVGTRHVLSYGGNVRHNAFDLSLAPRGDSRSEAGAYLQDEIFLSDHLRWVIGGRVDRFSVLDHAVFSPRTALLVKPDPHHTVRLSYNRAYRAPSLVNNFLDVTITEPIDLTPFAALNPALAGRTYLLPIQAVGNEDLDEQTMNAYELGYTGIINNRATVSAAVYLNETRDDIFFTELTEFRYHALNPPPGWPLPPQVLALIPPDGTLPARFTYLNLGRVRQKGFELGIDAVAVPGVNVFANYSYQATPDPDFDLSELNLPPKNRFNTGFHFSRDRYFGNLSLSYTDSAFWQDVLDVRFHGPTDSYTLVSVGAGLRWGGERLVTSVKITNLGNREVQQHVFGDVIKRQVVGEVRVGF